MTDRLAALCELIDRTPSFIDVGCDHGYVVKYVLENALSPVIAACDISEPSLDKARKLLGEHSGAEFVCADGAQAAKDYDTVFIAGMGGREIVHITQNCEPQTYILSPQSHVREVRISLLTRDYDIICDKTLKDGRKYYDIIKAVRGGGKKRLERTDGLMLEYGMFVRERNGVMLERLQKTYAALLAYPPTEKNAAKVREIEEVLKWQSL